MTYDEMVPPPASTGDVHATYAPSKRALAVTERTTDGALNEVGVADARLLGALMP